MKKYSLWLESGNNYKVFDLSCFVVSDFVVSANNDFFSLDLINDLVTGDGSTIITRKGSMIKSDSMRKKFLDIQDRLNCFFESTNDFTLFVDIDHDLFFIEINNTNGVYLSIENKKEGYKLYKAEKILIRFDNNKFFNANAHIWLYNHTL